MSAFRTARIALDTRPLTRDLVVSMVALQVVLAVLDATLHLGGGVATPELATVFDATGERGLASFVSVTQAGLIAATLFAMGAVYRSAGLARRQFLPWTAMGTFFAYCAVDDGVRFHEGVGSAFADSALSDAAGAFPSYYWQLLFGPVFAVIGLAMAVFLWRELRTARRRAIVVAAFGLLASAVALDFVDGISANHPWNLYARLSETDLAAQLSLATGLSPFDFVVHLSRVVEEGFETFAFTLLWAAFVLHLGTTLGGVTVHLGSHAPPAAPPKARTTPAVAPARTARQATRRARPRRETVPA